MQLRRHTRTLLKQSVFVAVNPTQSFPTRPIGSFRGGQESTLAEEVPPTLVLTTAATSRSDHKWDPTEAEEPKILPTAAGTKETKVVGGLAGVLDLQPPKTRYVNVCVTLTD